jgi:hypothetical protein
MEDQLKCNTYVFIYHYFIHIYVNIQSQQKLFWFMHENSLNM